MKLRSNLLREPLKRKNALVLAVLLAVGTAVVIKVGSGTAEIPAAGVDEEAPVSVECCGIDPHAPAAGKSPRADSVPPGSADDIDENAAAAADEAERDPGLLACEPLERRAVEGELADEPCAAPEEGPAAGLFPEDSVMHCLGKSFCEVKRLLGEPDEEGYSSLYGPHQYMLYRQEEGVLRFGSPEGEEKTVVSIILGPGQRVLGAKVGMTFPEIRKTLGEPEYGPDPGLDNLYYMDYFFGETDNGIPEILFSFSAEDITGPTGEAFIKWEGH